MTVKKAIGKVHLWLGLSSGLVVFIVALTGAIFSFQVELFELFHSRLVHIDPPKTDTARPMRIAELQDIAQLALGAGDTITLIQIYPEKNRAWEFEAFRYDRAKAAASFWDHAGLHWKTVYIDPYTGKVNGVKDMQYEFFTTIRSIHQNLFLNPGIGSPIVGTATIIFIVLLISGLVLWWPRNKAGAKQRFTFKWNTATKWKRKNYDLHNILGFYILIFGLFIALTGIVWSFDWWENTVYKMLDGKIVGFKLPQNPHPKRAAGDAPSILDQVADRIRAESPSFHRIFLSKTAATNTLTAGANYRSSSLWTSYNYHVYDLSTGEEFGKLLQSQKTTGQKWRNSNYDLHTGRTLGYAGMTLATCTSLIIASLPLTGFFIWLGRRKKERAPTSSVSPGPSHR